MVSCTGMSELDTLFQGILLRKPSSFYKQRRNDSALIAQVCKPILTLAQEILNEQIDYFDVACLVDYQ
jgi:hypothetical protein